MTGGRFLAFEGGEGAGKSTQAGMLAEALRAQGIEVLLTREPGGTPGAEAIRRLLLEPPGEGWGAAAEALLFAAARADHVARAIRPTLATGSWVISDRFVDSSRASHLDLFEQPGIRVQQSDNSLSCRFLAKIALFNSSSDPADFWSSHHGWVGRESPGALCYADSSSETVLKAVGGITGRAEKAPDLAGPAVVGFSGSEPARPVRRPQKVPLRA